MRKLTAMPMLDTESGLDRALAIRSEHPDMPVVVSDIWDNPGGGVAGDATHILRRMVERGMDNIGVATIWDPIAVSFCHAAGEGRRLICVLAANPVPKVASRSISGSGSCALQKQGGRVSEIAASRSAAPPSFDRSERKSISFSLPAARKLMSRISFPISALILPERRAAGEVHQPLPCGFCAGRFRDRLYRRAHFLSDRSGHNRLSQGKPPAMATGGRSAGLD